MGPFNEYSNYFISKTFLKMLQVKEDAGCKLKIFFKAIIASIDHDSERDNKVILR